MILQRNGRIGPQSPGYYQGMRGKWVLLAVCAVLAAAAAGALSLLRNRTAATSVQPPTVATQVPEVEEISLPGKVQAREVTAVAAPIDGTVEEFAVDVGDEVSEGQLLARIHNQSLSGAEEQARQEAERAQEKLNAVESAIIAARLEASRARADASRARSEYERLQKLYTREQLLLREGATPRLKFEKLEKEFLAAQTEFTSLEALAKQAEARVTDLLKDQERARASLEEKSAELEAAQTELQATEVHAPVDGVIVARRGQAGDEVSRSVKDLFQIGQDLSKLDVAVEAHPSALKLMKQGQPAVVHIAEMDQYLEGSVRAVEESRVLVAFSSPSPAIKPGMTVQVRIKLR
jgi:multidrug resistance efflux pump